jgi:hypothetical protein
MFVAAVDVAVWGGAGAGGSISAEGCLHAQGRRGGGGLGCECAIAGHDRAYTQGDGVQSLVPHCLQLPQRPQGGGAVSGRVC